MMITSPCTGICKLDDATGWCLGCGRSGEEIVDWGNYASPSRERVWTEIPARLVQLGVACRRLPWTTEETITFVAESLERTRGTWVMGVVGGIAEFAAKSGEAIDVSIVGDCLVAKTDGGALRMVIDDDVRALTFDPEGAGDTSRVVLAVKRSRDRPALAEGIVPLGEDLGALIEENATQLYDLGLGRKEARFCIRVKNGPAKETLTSGTGIRIDESLSKIGPTLIAESPTRVVETALGRIEVQGQIPAPTAASPAGSHTHLLPDHLAQNRAMPVGMDLPRAYLPGAIFYPAN